MPGKIRKLPQLPNSQSAITVQFGGSKKIGIMQKHQDFAAELLDRQGTGG